MPTDQRSVRSLCFFCWPAAETYGRRDPCEEHQYEMLPPGWLSCQVHHHLEPDGRCSCWPKAEQLRSGTRMKETPWAVIQTETMTPKQIEKVRVEAEVEVDKLRAEIERLRATVVAHHALARSSVGPSATAEATARLKIADEIEAMIGPFTDDNDAEVMRFVARRVLRG